MINKIKFYLMHLAEYLLLSTKVSSILNKYDETELQLTVAKTKVQQSSDYLQNNMKLVKANLRTEEMLNLDANRDNAWKSFNYFVLSQAYCLNAEKREYANKLLTLIRTPEMRIYKMGYQDETASLINFFNRIDSNPEFAEAIEKISAQQRYTQLKTAQKAFTDKEAERVDEEADKPNAKGKEAARQVRESIESLNRFLAVMKDMTGKEEYDKIAAEVNEVVVEINSRVNSRTTRHRNAKEEEEVTEN
ncbi:DUF6261 family protein [Ancylomarina longa]|uniref:Uncharacterized protein n=1 Tax=Ancylomarina longa TaxID=2487017 RepID=A0A434AUF6_9BACT|nr:DUF6261 family protein [Ancylomarina longa]RUT78082.1 hypothetical protein DLK05_09545 [Ancylomarina longa]